MKCLDELSLGTRHPAKPPHKSFLSGKAHEMDVLRLISSFVHQMPAPARRRPNMATHGVGRRLASATESAARRRYDKSVRQ